MMKYALMAPKWTSEWCSCSHQPPFPEWWDNLPPIVEKTARQQHHLCSWSHSHQSGAELLPTHRPSPSRRCCLLWLHVLFSGNWGWRHWEPFYLPYHEPAQVIELVNASHLGSEVIPVMKQFLVCNWWMFCLCSEERPHPSWDYIPPKGWCPGTQLGVTKDTGGVKVCTVNWKRKYQIPVHLKMNVQLSGTGNSSHNLDVNASVLCWGKVVAESVKYPYPSAFACRDMSPTHKSWLPDRYGQLANCLVVRASIGEWFLSHSLLLANHSLTGSPMASFSVWCIQWNLWLRK